MFSIREALGEVGVTTTCSHFTCGQRGHCVESALHGAHCECEAGYEGNGFLCNPASELALNPIFTASKQEPWVADLHVSILDGDRVGVVYRDMAQRNCGYLLLVEVQQFGMRWGRPWSFSRDSAAFGPVLAGLQDGTGFAIAFRDHQQHGAGILVGGSYRQARSMLKLAARMKFARRQSQGAALVQLPGSHVVLLFEERSLHGDNPRGAAALAKVYPNGKPAEILGTYHFAEGAVSELSALMLSPTSFALGFRNEEQKDDGQHA